MKKFITGINFQGVTKGTITRAILTVLVIINYVLEAIGKNPLTVNESEITTWVTIILTVGTLIASYWKNNSWTSAAQEADKKLEELKNEQ